MGICLPEGMSVAGLTDTLQTTLKYVYRAVKDWRVMMAKAREVNTHLVSTSCVLPDAEMKEATDFFDWLLNNHFIFLGFVGYDFYNAGGEESLSPMAGTELGIFALPEAGLPHRGLSALPPELQHFAAQTNPIEITKSNQRSLVHRDVLMDYVGVKRYDESGRVIGEYRFLGLFTSPVYYQQTSEIPYIRQKVNAVMEAVDFDRSGHSGKALQTVLELFPRDELFQISTENLLEISLGIVALEERPDIRVFFRRDLFERFVSCLVYMPRDKFNTFVRREVAKILEDHLQGTVSVFYSQLTESPLARVNYLVHTKVGKIPDVDMDVLNHELRFIVNYWTDALRESLHDGYGEQVGEQIFQTFVDAFPRNYINVTQIEDALQDIVYLQRVINDKAPQFQLFHAGKKDEWHLKMYALDTDIALSEVLPILEHMGMKVRDVVPHRLQVKQEKQTVALLIRDFSLANDGHDHRTFAMIKPLLEEALQSVWLRQAESDALNALIALAELNTRQIMLLRAYCHYAKQAELGYSHQFMAQALCKHAVIARQLVIYFERRFDPTQGEGREIHVQATLDALMDALAKVDNLSEDKVLRFLTEIIGATLRTNYFQVDAAGHCKPYISFKLESARVPNLPKPHPWREIFVYSMTTSGIHLRGGSVARGGLRWSDRHEDFRTEVLGLMKAQRVKNTVIVPTGSKGGFVVKVNTDGMDRDGKLQAGIASYREFLSGLLDITDNRLDDAVIVPPQVVRYDEDDPYLVVAADKGTATFSDIANGVAKEYGFWLDDAFASGGSVGYDHKKMGITARGGWVSVERHFSEMGRDIAGTPFTVVGIGDMSGDVFGNGMLLSRQIKLLAAFNHLHIFIDPTPDPDTSYVERERLFTLARGSWDMYDATLISEGGGVFSRQAKTIPLTPQMQAMLGVTATNLAPNELIRSILKAEVDLLWNGGIGTYIKASTESHESVGDMSNNGVRINGDELRCRIVGEGGNLGMTQRGRIEYARLGGRLNTDAIDNSAGVDCSDHEVNIKIALYAAMQQQAMTMESRNALLSQMTDDVASLVLRDNQQQNLALSIAEYRAAESLDLHTRLIRSLEHDGLLDRLVEYLPTDKQLTDLRAERAGLTRPELAVLMAYSKIALYHDLASSSLVSDALFETDLLAYFPLQLQSRCRELLLAHPLKRELVATSLTNEIVNRAGMTYIHALHYDTGYEVCNIVRAYVVVREVFDLYDLWGEIEALQHTPAAAVMIDLFSHVTRFLERMTIWFLNNHDQPLNMQECIVRFRGRIAEYVTHMHSFVSSAAHESRMISKREWVEKGVSETLAERIVTLEGMISACDIAVLDEGLPEPLSQVGAVYYMVGARLQLSWLRLFVREFPVEHQWDKLAINSALNELYEHQRRLTESILRDMTPDLSLEDGVERWINMHQADVERYLRLVYEMKSQERHDMAMMVVGLRQLSSIRHA
jgi:glutamate dehydrogenase